MIIFFIQILSHLQPSRFAVVCSNVKWVWHRFARIRAPPFSFSRSTPAFHRSIFYSSSLGVMLVHIHLSSCTSGHTGYHSTRNTSCGCTCGRTLQCGGAVHVVVYSMWRRAPCGGALHVAARSMWRRAPCGGALHVAAHSTQWSYMSMFHVVISKPNPNLFYIASF